MLHGDYHKSRSATASSPSPAAAGGTTSVQVDVLHRRVVPNATANSAANSAVAIAGASAIAGDGVENPDIYFPRWGLDDRPHRTSADARQESSSTDREGMTSAGQALAAADLRDMFAVSSNDGDVAVHYSAVPAPAKASEDIRPHAHSRLLAPWSLDDSTQALFGQRQPQLSTEFAPFAPSSLSKEVHLAASSQLESEEGRPDFWNARAEGAAAGGEPIDVAAFLREFKRSEHSGEGVSGMTTVRW